jgi:hypothetical protein
VNPAESIRYERQLSTFKSRQYIGPDITANYDCSSVADAGYAKASRDCPPSRIPRRRVGRRLKDKAVRTISGFIVTALVGVLWQHPAPAAPNAELPDPAEKPGEITPGNPSADQIPTVDGKPLQSIINDKDYIEQLVRYLIGYETWIHMCADAEPEERLRTLVVGEPQQMPGIDDLNSPQWLEVIRVRGCDRTYERLIYATYHDGKPVFHAQLAGSSKTGPRLQHETLTALRRRETERAHAAGCERADSARVIAAELDKAWPQAADGRWREVWTVHSCKGASDVPVQFQTGPDGTVTFRFEAP